MTPEQIAADIMDNACLPEKLVKMGVDAALRRSIAEAIRKERCGGKELPSDNSRPSGASKG